MSNLMIYSHHVFIFMSRCLTFLLIFSGKFFSFTFQRIFIQLKKAKSKRTSYSFFNLLQKF